MNLFHVSAAIVCLILSTEARPNLPKEKNGRPVNKEMYDFIMRMVDVGEAIEFALRWDVISELDYFEFYQEYIDNVEDYEKALKNIIDGAQRILNMTLDEIGYKKKVDIKRFVNAIYNYTVTKTIRDIELLRLAKMIYNYRMSKIAERRKSS